MTQTDQPLLLKWGMLEVYFKYTGSILPKNIWSILPSILEAYFKYTLSILQVYFNLLNYRRRSSSLYYFNKRSTFEAHFVKLNQHFNVNLKYTSSIL